MDSTSIADLKRQAGDRRAAFEAVAAEIAREMAEIAAIGPAAVPVIEWAAIAHGAVPPTLPNLIRRRGCVVVRRVFAPAQAQAWDAEIATYLMENDADGASRARRPGRWGGGPPQIYSIYWSRPQVWARQSEQLAVLRSWLNRLWRWQGWFDPDLDCTYADRLRRRMPGDASLALGPHIDGGTAGRWLDPAARRPYRAVLAGDPCDFDPFDAAFRAEATGNDANGCSVFRTWQGWTALTAQGPGDGTLMVLPVARAVAWVLLRPFLPDVPAGSLCGAENAKALFLNEEWHAPLLRGLVPIPRVEPGDTVWWHPDLIHAVEAQHSGTHPSNVMYIGAAPDCPRNRAYLAPQLAAFRDGRSPPDFPPDDLEVGFVGRAGPDLLTARGRQQLGLI